MVAREGAGGGVRVEVHDLLVDIKAEKVEATEVKLEDMDLSPESTPAVNAGVDALLGNAYSAAVEKLGVGGVLVPEVGGARQAEADLEEKSASGGPLITLADDDKDGPAKGTATTAVAPTSASGGGFLFGEVGTSGADAKLLPEMNPREPRVWTGASDDRGLLAHMTGSSGGVELGTARCALEEDAEDAEFKLAPSLTDLNAPGDRETGIAARGAAGFTEVATETEGDAMAKGAGMSSAADAGSTASDTERSDDGKDKEAKKIQTTTTTQVNIRFSTIMILPHHHSTF